MSFATNLPRLTEEGYEDLTKTSEAWIYQASIRLLIRRLA